jgi:hypothetical protein
MAVYVGYVTGILLFGLPSSFFLIASVAKIKICENEVLIERLILGTSYWSFDNIRFKIHGRILAYGGIYGGWIIPLKWRECVETIDLSRSKVTSARREDLGKICPLIWLFSIPILLFIIGKVAAYFEFAISPLAWASFWALSTALPITVYLYTAPIQIEIGKFNKKQTAIIIGLMIGLLIFLSVFLIYSVAKL